ncbi:MAG: SPOR domain-containing protein [Proteobacteria bacterium]|nr:SPOR domain-containing protein [Pseudomonadota bacterium]
MDKALKQRMVGATVLIALAVIILPMLLGGRPEGDSQQSRKIELPAQPPELSFETRRYPIGEQGLEQQAKKDPSTPEDTVRQLPPPKVPASKVDKPDAVNSTVGKSGIDEQASMPVVTSNASVPLENSPDTGRFVVQVASFGALDNANKLSATLRSNGYSVITHSVKSEVGVLHRVRVGPYASEAEANRTASDLESKVPGVKPRVMDLQPGKSAQITTPSDPLIRWIVQLGSFSSAANAEKLVASLRLDGLSAYSEMVSSSGSSIYRVRIGPFLQREEAMRVESQVRQKNSLDGVVMSTD